MKPVTVSVPGKVILMGDHAIVYGKPALISAVNMRMHVTVGPKEQDAPDTEHVQIECGDSPDLARRAVEYVLHHLRMPKPDPCKVRIESDIPSGYHLGSSAALAVGIAGALMLYLKRVWNPIRINEIAYEIEKLQHGTPSGGDNTAVTMGGFIWYWKELEFLKSIWQLPFPLPKRLDHFYLIDTGKPKEHTGEMVAFVRQRVKEHADHMYALFDQNETQVKRVTQAVKAGDAEELMDAIRKGQHTLEDMGVVSHSVLPCIREIEKRGGAAKILGGGGIRGGVGYLLCYHETPAAVQEICSAVRYDMRTVNLGEEGVRVESR